jgi:hypothetical protein
MELKIVNLVLPSVFLLKSGSDLGKKRKTISFLLKGSHTFENIPVKRGKLL